VVEDFAFATQWRHTLASPKYSYYPSVVFSIAQSFQSIMAAEDVNPEMDGNAFEELMKERTRVR